MSAKEYELLTDDYVAEMLAKEASDYSLRYSAMGLEAYRSAGKPANKAKPNTRFLRTIIKETKNHNEALLAREAAEVQAKLRLKEDGEREERRHWEGSRDRRSRDGSRERRRYRDDSRDRRKRRDDSSDGQDRRKRMEEGHRGEDRERHRRDVVPAADIRKRQLGNISAILAGTGGAQKKRKRDEEHCRTGNEAKADEPRLDDSICRIQKDATGLRIRGLAKDPGESNGAVERERGKPREILSLSTDRQRLKRLSSPPASDGKDEPRGPRERREEPRKDKEGNNSRCAASADQEDDHRKRRRRRSTSDPLDDFIGPSLPDSTTSEQVRPRGRGAITSSSSGIDDRFSSAYDPRSDIAPQTIATSYNATANGCCGANSDGIDANWDEALEAFRDRQKWKAQGADRLRAAGFSEGDIRKWEKGDRKDVEDVQWGGKGTEREWDRRRRVEDSDK